jgi:phage antirepressor YoqD-like protein
VRISNEMLRAWQRLGKQGIDEAGGLEGVASQYRVASSALRNYLRADGTLTKRAEDRLNPPAKEITLDMLRAWQRLGKQGMDEAGGRDGVASQYGVASVTLKHYLRADGTLTKRAEDRLNPPAKEITLEMLRAWQRLGKQGIEKAGGLDGVAKQYGVASVALRTYLRADGALTKRAEVRLRNVGAGPT